MSIHLKANIDLHTRLQVRLKIKPSSEKREQWENIGIKFTQAELDEIDKALVAEIAQLEHRWKEAWNLKGEWLKKAENSSVEEDWVFKQCTEELDAALTVTLEEKLT